MPIDPSVVSPVDPSVASDAKQRRNRRRLLVKRRREAQAMSSSGSIKKSVSFHQPVGPHSDASVGQCSKAGLNKTSFRSILKGSNKAQGKKEKPNTRGLEPTEQTRPCPSPPPGPPPTIPQRQRVSLSAPSPNPSQYTYTTDSTNSTDYVYTLRKTLAAEEAMSVGLCGEEEAPWKQAAETLQDQIQDRMATTCAGQEGVMGMGSCVDDTGSIKQDFSCGAIDVKEYQRKLPASWCGTLDCIKERFRSEAMDEACCSTAMKRVTSCHDGDVDISSSHCAGAQDTTATLAKSTLKATYDMIVAADETIGPVVGEGCIQTEAWCKDNIVILLAMDCQTEVNLCKEESWPGAANENQDVALKGSDPAGETLMDSPENEKALRESVIVRHLKSAGASIRQSFEAMLPPSEAQPRNVVIVDLPPDFGHDSKNLKDKPPTKSTDKAKAASNGEPSSQTTDTAKNKSNDKSKEKLEVKSKECKILADELGTEESTKTPACDQSKKALEDASESEAAIINLCEEPEEMAQSAHQPAQEIQTQEVDTTEEIQQAILHDDQKPGECEKSLGKTQGPQEPDGDKPIPDDLSMERRKRSEVVEATVTTQNTRNDFPENKTIIDCILVKEDEVSAPISQGTETNPIQLEDNRALLSKTRKYPEELLAVDTDSYVSVLTASAGTLDTTTVVNSDIQEHVKELVEEYIIRRTKQKKEIGSVTIDAREATNEVLSNLKSHLTQRSKEKALSSISVLEQRESPPEANTLPGLPSEKISEDIATASSNKHFVDLSFGHEIIDLSAVHSSEHRDDQLAPSSSTVAKRNYERETHQQGDAHSWLLRDSRYDNETQELTDSQHLKPPLPSPVFGQSSFRNIAAPDTSTYRILPKRTNSVSFQDSPDERDDASKAAESCGSSRARSTSTSTSTYRNKRAIILARREELAALSKRQAQLFARGRRTIQSRLASGSMFQDSTLS